jgi:carbon-monoxide dehydrogenase medium subunit
MNYDFGYVAPASRSELLDLLSSGDPGTRLLAGGTDLIVNVRLGFQKPAIVVDVKKISEHGRITWDDREGLTIGPAVTINQLLVDRTVRKLFPALIAAGSQLASYQLRNRATVIGNLCNASPCADMAPPLLCLGARLILTSTRGSRELPLAQFFTGPKQTALEPGEYFEKLAVPAESAGARGDYRKLKRIRGHDIGLVSVALTKRAKLMRVAVGSAGPKPVLCRDFDVKEPVKRVLADALERVSPIDDVRCSRDYRFFMIETYIERLMKEVR